MQHEELLDVFAYFDGDDSGEISTAEFQKALSALGSHFSHLTSKFPLVFLMLVF